MHQPFASRFGTKPVTPLYPLRVMNPRQYLRAPPTVGAFFFWFWLGLRKGYWFFFPFPFRDGIINSLFFTRYPKS